MPLIEKLRKWAKELDASRWHDGGLDVEMVELSDLLAEAAKRLEFYEVLPFAMTIPADEYEELLRPSGIVHATDS